MILLLHRVKMMLLPVESVMIMLLLVHWLMMVLVDWKLLLPLSHRILGFLARAALVVQQPQIKRYSQLLNKQ